MEFMCSLNVVESMFHFVFALFVFGGEGVYLAIIVLYPAILIFMFKYDS
jgi:hypothetical protein